MTPLTPRLQQLVDQLDALGGEATLAGIARVLEVTALTPAEVAPFVAVNTASYNRARIIRRDRYELLVMTWLPGQTSVPHDHTGSVCAMQTVQGTAVEADYSIADDGYADLEYETPVPAGQVTAGQDAGIHTIRNPSATETLVTVHVYAPPLNEFRRFAPRPTPAADAPRSEKPTVVIVGGGFSGTMAAAQLLRTGADLRVTLVERRGTIAEGVAYGTRDIAHLLNVPAARMSAWPDRPEDFLAWAKKRNAAVKPGDFLPRAWYSEYLRETLHRTAAESRAQLDVALDEVRRVARHPAGGWMVHLGRGASLRADAVVLAIGHRPPSDPLRSVWVGSRDRFLADPWRPFAVAAIPPEESVAVLGSGLTAIDTVLSLAHQPRTASITLLSRNGLLPQAHAVPPPAAADLGAFVQTLLDSHPNLRAVTLSRAVHREARRWTAAGGDWRSVVDGLRPHTARLWQHLSLRERRQFIVRLRPYWEVHRHRMAASIANQLKQLRDAGAVITLPGLVTAAVATTAGVTLHVRPRGADAPVIRHVQWVINCTGPAPSNNAEANPVIGSLLVHDWVRRDELSLGLDTTAGGQAVAANGEAVPDLWVLGTLRKPLLWESTAVPELRQQAAVIGDQVLRYVSCRTSNAG